MSVLAEFGNQCKKVVFNCTKIVESQLVTQGCNAIQVIELVELGR